MKFDILMKKIGADVKYKITKIHVSLGQEVKIGDTLFEVEAGKANKPVASEYNGVVKELLVEEYTEVDVDQKVLVIEGEEEKASASLDVLMPKAAKVTKVHVVKGQEVKAGDVLFEIEGAKTNQPVNAESDGIVKEVYVEEGDDLGAGEKVMAIEGAAAKATDENGAVTKEKKEYECDIAIIGGGPGGYVAAIKGAREGKKVIVIEKDKMGGTCLNRGCIPTKALVRSIEVLENIKNSESYGLGKFTGEYDFEKMIDRKDQVVSQLVAGVENLMATNQITVLSGHGKLEDKETISVAGKDFDATIKAKNTIIAAGSRPAVIPIPGIDGANVLNSTEILDMKTLPKSIVIVGGGVIGMEFGFILNALGVEISVVDIMPRILPPVDTEVAEELQNIAIKKGMKIYTSAKLERIEDIENGQSLVVAEKDGKQINLIGDKVFISIGRALNTEDLGLEELGIEMDRRAIKVNEYLQTSVENIYAIGDINGKYMLAHVASMEGHIAIDNILGESKAMDYTCVPSAIFTHPEIASVGLTEKEARDKGIEVKIGKFPYAANGKALAAGEDEGFVKIIADKDGKILGGWIIGYNAADLIPQITLAMNNGLTVEEIVHTIYAHPTISECIPEACHGVFEHPYHLPK